MSAWMDRMVGVFSEAWAAEDERQEHAGVAVPGARTRAGLSAVFAARPEAVEHEIVVYRHNGSSYALKGNRFAVGVAREQAIAEPLTKSFGVYLVGPEKSERVEYVNYTKLKELRDA